MRTQVQCRCQRTYLESKARSPFPPPLTTGFFLSLSLRRISSTCAVIRSMSAGPRFLPVNLSKIDFGSTSFGGFGWLLSLWNSPSFILQHSCTGTNQNNQTKPKLRRGKETSKQTASVKKGKFRASFLNFRHLTTWYECSVLDSMAEYTCTVNKQLLQFSSGQVCFPAIQILATALAMAFEHS